MFGRKPTQDTSDEALQRLMENAEVTATIVEVLMPNPGNTADPSKGEMGKKKNHWVFHFTVDPEIPYYRGG
ncbi:hypothetical protein CGMCC3_g9927 [Colletotrichum fructicola]|uniref:Uncharacterized protein n=1 Tax=Colletotrichum fructicola (strain Nara gc5) TaxID=1213859 RepID=A0A7J6IX54_COLFN|nr:uncharacterized protein CGMCC3_g9927 [Colletotrichum fructicola]KAE9574013.1 hypothetical protein CGMCC3_g9927 [Colletotrichum fructicola]KAF4481837.1 hypothetical protein CGGC5_v009023 [Colletotrichum fructicola Nara gc5]KAF4883542.1 hypothetical protein CGCFRS4_v013510 [Colletotrichum fructicola]